jgi:RNA-directed DNA polymerase
MLKYGKEVRLLAALKQKYLCYLSSVHGLRSKYVEQEVCNLVNNLDLRVFAIDCVYRSNGNFTPGVDGQTLKKENLLSYLDKLSSKELDKYKSDEILRVYISKSNGRKRPLGIPTIKDRIVQTLFLQVMEPIIDPHADPNSFGFRKGRNGLQAIGTLSALLNSKPHARRLRNKITHRYLKHSIMVINLDIKSFFDEVSHEYLLDNYPIPRKYKHILKA